MQNSGITKFIIMGVSGSGKSSVGSLLSNKIDAVFLDGDEMHPPENITKMSSGQPLDDDDRHPWLQNIGKALKDEPGSIIIACSALKKIYRDLIREMAEQEVIFVHLVGSLDIIKNRMSKRTGHFMPLSLLESQFETLETPKRPENFMAIDIDQSLESIIEQLTHLIKNRC
tara:strand:- start:582 stop:1094 length:513 start_codon:yes stop_codon:yes gene_type:complete